MLFRVFCRFVTHYMWDMVPETEEQGGVCPLEEAVGDSDIRPCLADCFQEIGLEWDADALPADAGDRGAFLAGKADFAGKADGAVSKYLVNPVLAAFGNDFRVVDQTEMVAAQVVQLRIDGNAVVQKRAGSPSDVHIMQKLWLLRQDDFAAQIFSDFQLAFGIEMERIDEQFVS